MGIEGRVEAVPASVIQSVSVRLFVEYFESLLPEKSNKG